MRPRFRSCDKQLMSTPWSCSSSSRSVRSVVLEEPGHVLLGSAELAGETGVRADGLGEAEVRDAGGREVVVGSASRGLVSCHDDAPFLCWCFF